MTRVEFYDGTTLKATPIPPRPTVSAWAFTSANAGSHVWTAKAYDAAGNVGTSAGLTLVVLGSTPNVSINSTSQDAAAVVTSAVPQQAQVLNTSYSIVAINDLGMHCGDLDTWTARPTPAVPGNARAGHPMACKRGPGPGAERLHQLHEPWPIDSARTCHRSPAANLPLVPNADYAVLAINDLGMHCGRTWIRASPASCRRSRYY